MCEQQVQVELMINSQSSAKKSHKVLGLSIGTEMQS